MSTQIDIIRKRGEPGQGSWVRIKEIGKSSTPTLDDRYRVYARSVNLTWQLSANRQRTPKVMFRSLRPLPMNWRRRRKCKVFLQQASSFWCATVLAIYRAKTRSFSASTREYF